MIVFIGQIFEILMSDEMILSGAQFDNSMPKWATEDTMKKLGLEFKKDRAVTKKQYDRMIFITGNIAKMMTKGEKNSLEQTKSLKDISASLKKIEKNDAQTLAELKKISKSFEDSKKASSTGTISRDTTNIVDAIEDGTSVLEKINRSIREMSRGLEHRLGSYSSSIKDSTAAVAKKSTISRINDHGKTPRSGTESIIQSHLESINDNLEQQRRYSRISDIASRHTITPSPRAGAAIPGVTGIVGAIGGLYAGFKKLMTLVWAAVKRLPLIGAQLTALSMGISKVLDFTEIIRQSGDNYREMIRNGLSFVEETLNGARMDGIRMRRIIAEAGLTFEVGLKRLRENITMINEIGITDFLSTVKSVMGNAQDATSFMNRVMMSQDEISEFTGIFLANLKTIGDLERLNSEDRAAGIQEFIKNTKMLSEITGKSMEVISKMLHDVTADARTRLMLLGMDETQRERTNLALQSLGAVLGTENEVFRGLADAIVDPRGAGLMGTAFGPVLQQISHALTGDSSLFNMFQGVVDDVRSGNVDPAELVTTMNQIVNTFNSGMQDVSENSRSMLLAFMHDKSSPIYGVMTALQTMQASVVTSMDNVADMIERSGEETVRSSRLARIEQQTANARAQTEAAAQLAVAMAADSDITRATLLASYEAMIMASDLGERAANAAIVTGTYIKENLPFLSSAVDSILGILDEDHKTREQRAKEALRLTPRELGIAAATGRDNLNDRLSELGINRLSPSDEANAAVMGIRARGRRELRDNYGILSDVGLDVESLMASIKGDDAVAAHEAKSILAYLSSNMFTGILSHRDRQKYTKALDEVMGSMTDMERELAYTQIESQLKSGVLAHSILDRINRVSGISMTVEEQLTDKMGSVDSAVSEAEKQINEQRARVEEKEKEIERERPERNGGNIRRGTGGFLGANIQNVDSTVSNDNILNTPSNNYHEKDLQLESLLNQSSMASSAIVAELKDIKLVLGRLDSGSISS